jgi:hypothetical protein
MKNQPQVQVPSRDAGRALDALIAEEVMGIAVVRGSHRHHFYLPDSDEEVAPYSTDIAAAWLVVERMRMSVVRSDDGWYAIVPEDIQHGSLRGTAYPTITLVNPEGKYPEPAETAPLAICRAALAAVETQ